MKIKQCISHNHYVAFSSFPGFINDDGFYDPQSDTPLEHDPYELSSGVVQWPDQFHTNN